MTPGIHLHFTGQCRPAFEFYAELLGATIEGVFTYGDTPAADQVPADMKDHVVHATMRIGDLEIAGADVTPEQHQPCSGFHILLQVEDSAEAQRIFDGLSRDGNVTMPLQETFWSPCYGTAVDRFGVPWEINTGGGS